MFLLVDKVQASSGSDYSLKIGVAHSQRVKGKRNSRPVKIAHIGSFRVRNWRHVERGYCEAEKLWKKADKVFEKLNLAPDDEANLRHALEKRVPPPPPIPPPRVRGAALSWCNSKVWKQAPVLMHAYRRKP